MQERIAPSERKAQEIEAMLQGQSEGQSGEELLSTLVRLSTERGLQEALGHEQAGLWAGAAGSLAVLPRWQVCEEASLNRSTGASVFPHGNLLHGGLHERNHCDSLG